MRNRLFAVSWIMANIKFQMSKRKAAAKKKQKQIQIKEIKLRPATEEADYQVKTAQYS